MEVSYAPPRLSSSASDIACLYHVTSSVRLLVEPSLLQAQRSGTLYQIVSETRLSAAAASGNYLRRTSSTVTRHIERSRDAV